MGPVVYILVVLGCADDLIGCRTIERVEQGWASAAQCDAAMAEILLQHTAADYPMLTGTCEPANGPLIAAEPGSKSEEPAG